MFSSNDRVLAVFAHPDDAELTCFGTLAQLVTMGAEVSVLIATRGQQSTSAIAQTRIAESLQASTLGDYAIIVEDLPDGQIPFNSMSVSVIDRYVRDLAPTVIITHYPQRDGTGHQDHVALASAVVATVRRHQGVRALLYAEPPTQSWDFVPNVFIEVTRSFAAKKGAVLLHQSEQGKAYMLTDAVEAKARWWSYQAYVEGYSDKRFEAFQLVKFVA